MDNAKVIELGKKGITLDYPANIRLFLKNLKFAVLKDNDSIILKGVNNNYEFRLMKFDDERVMMQFFDMPCIFKPPKMPFLLHLLHLKCTCNKCNPQAQASH